MIKSKTYLEVETKKEPVIRTGDKVLDDFISNESGFVVGSSIFLTGTSGAGKTTFAVTLQKVFKDYVTSLYSREMSAGSVKEQMKRYAISHQNAFIADRESHPTLEDYIKELNELKPKVIIIDSLQVIMKEDYANVPAEQAGFEVIQKLRNWTEKNNAVLIMVGHVNKDGEFEGRNTIKHMFDAHLEMIFNKKTKTRTISWSKNRKGEIGMLYYDFGKERIEFFTEEQWDARKNNKKLSDFLFDTVVNYTAMYKNHKNFKELSKELRKEWLNILKNNSLNSEYEMVFALTLKAKELLTKYNIEQ